MRRTHLIAASVAAAIATALYGSACGDDASSGDPIDTAMTAELEIALGLQAAPRLAERFGGLSQDPQQQASIDRIGAVVVGAAGASVGPYPFDFHVLATGSTVNSRSLPGGQVFVTEGLLRRLNNDSSLIAAVLAHEVGHVVERHSAEQIARADLENGVTGAAALADYDPRDNDSRNAEAVATAIDRLIAVRYTAAEEAEADDVAIRVLAQSPYGAEGLIQALSLLAPAQRRAESTDYAQAHPSSAARIQRARASINSRLGRSTTDAVSR